MNVKTGQIWYAVSGNSTWKAVITSVDSARKTVNFKLVENSEKAGDGTTFVTVFKLEDAKENHLSLTDFLMEYRQ